jgi:hypothetical protein
MPTIPHPALVEHAQERAANIQNRIADRITRYAGSMHFVYLHIALFAIWMILIEESPWPTGPCASGLRATRGGPLGTTLLTLRSRSR